METPQEIREILKNALSNLQSARSSFPTVLVNKSKPLQPRLQPQAPVSIPARFAAAFAAVDALESFISLQSTQDAIVAAQNLPPAPAISQKKRKRYEPETDTAVNTKRLSFQRQELPTTAAFPPTVITDPWPLNRESLEAYIRHVNKQGIVRLHLWYRARTLQEPSTAEVMSRRTQLTYLRLTIPDLLVAYLDIEQKTEEKSGYQVLLVTVFGIREKKLPHCASDYSIFLKMSQVLTSMLQSHPEADIPAVVGLLSSYRNLYSEPCFACGHHWTVEGDLPPVHRVWLPYATLSDTADGPPGRWTPRHHMCSQVPPEQQNTMQRG